MNNKKIIKKLIKNKIGKELTSLMIIIIILFSILATTLYYQNNITGKVVKETSAELESTETPIKEVNEIKELN